MSKIYVGEDEYAIEWYKEHGFQVDENGNVQYRDGLALDGSYTYEKIDELPAYIFDKIENSKCLVLDNNNLKSLPREMVILKELVLLRLNNNKFEKIPEVVGDLKKLKSLEISGNKIRDLKPLKKLKQLKSLICENNKLELLPDYIYKNKNMKKIVFTNNSIEFLAPPLVPWKNIQVISFDNNKIEEIPENFFKMINLKYLNLSNNPIKDLSVEIENLTNLSYLKLNNIDAELEDITDSIGKLTELSTLEFTGNNVKSLDFLRDLTNLKKLICDDNNIDEFPEVMKFLVLEEINFTKNNIEEIDNIIIPSMKKIGASENKIYEIPDSFYESKTLFYVDLSKNEIEELKPIKEMTNLQHLYLSNNKISTIPDPFELPRVTPNEFAIFLNDNQLKKAPRFIKPRSIRLKAVMYKNPYYQGNLSRTKSTRTLTKDSFKTGNAKKRKYRKKRHNDRLIRKMNKLKV